MLAIINGIGYVKETVGGSAQLEQLQMHQTRGRQIIGRPRWGRRRAVAPRYVPGLWNHYDAALAGVQKSNNLSEGWHNLFNILIRKAHPDLYSALNEFQKEQADSERMIAELNVGKRVKAALQNKQQDTQRHLKRVGET